MKRFYFLFLLLPAFGASAQTVGVNTRTPEATLDVRAGSGTTTNEGIRAPLLIKTRVAAIASPREGTLVYVKAESASAFTTYAGSDAKVAEFIASGYYFYSGRKWVKVNNEREYGRDKLREYTKADGISPRTDEGNVFITSDGRFDHKNSFSPPQKRVIFRIKLSKPKADWFYAKYDAYNYAYFMHI